MNFTITRARYHPLSGLELTDQHGDVYLASTKWSLMQAGVVTLLMTKPGECPYRVRYNFKDQPFMPDEEREIDGTNDPVALALALAYHDGSPNGYTPGWAEISLPASLH